MASQYPPQSSHSQTPKNDIPAHVQNEALASFIASHSIDNKRFLMEQFTLEVFSNFHLFNRLRDNIGLVTQWGVGAWMILQELSEHENISEAELEAKQHISHSYSHKMVQELIKEGLIKRDNNGLSLLPSGIHALEKLHETLEEALPDFTETFSLDELQTTVSTLAKLRKVLTNN